MNNYEQQAIEFLNSTNTTLEIEFLKLDYHLESDTEKRNIFKCTLSNKNHSYSFNFGSSIADSYKKEFINKWDNLKNEDLVTIGYSLNFLTYKFSVTVINKVKKSDVEKNIFSVIDNLNDEFFNEYIKEAKRLLIKKTGHNYNILKNELLNRDNNYFKEGLKKSIIKQIEQLKYEKIEAYKTPKEEIQKPSAYDILARLEKYEVGTFEDFCDNYGYDSDSINTKKIYKAVLKIYKAVLKEYKAVLKEYKNVCKIWNESEIEQLREIS